MSYSNEVFENVPIGTEVITVSATDIDSGKLIFFMFWTEAEDKMNGLMASVFQLLEILPSRYYHSNKGTSVFTSKYLGYPTFSYILYLGSKKSKEINVHWMIQWFSFPVLNFICPTFWRPSSFNSSSLLFSKV